MWRPDSPSWVDARYRGSLSNDGSPDYLSIWLFNITNVEAIRKGYKPQLQEIGPFVYRKYHARVSTLWDDQGQVQVKDFYYHLPILNESVGRAEDFTIVSLSLPLIGVIENVHSSFGPLGQRLLDLLVATIAKWRDNDHHVNGLFSVRTAEELIWGYEDPLLQRLSVLLPKGFVKSTRVELFHNMTDPEEAMSSEPVVIDTGYFNMSRIGNIVSDKGLTVLTCWNNCTEFVQGTDGTQFPPGVTRHDRLPVWTAQLFRSIHLIFLQEVEWLKVRLLRFWMDPDESDVDSCHNQRIKGLRNITTPMAIGAQGIPKGGSAPGPPIYVSLPHFCLCDESLAEQYEGLSCDLDRHMTWVDVEPITGISLRAQQRIMVSSDLSLAARMHVEPQIARWTNQSMIMPIYWSQEYVHATEGNLQQLKGSVYRALFIKSFISYVLPITGFALLIVSSVLWFIHRKGQGINALRESRIKKQEEGSMTEPILSRINDPD